MTRQPAQPPSNHRLRPKPPTLRFEQNPEPQLGVSSFLGCGLIIRLRLASRSVLAGMTVATIETTSRYPADQWFHGTVRLQLMVFIQPLAKSFGPTALLNHHLTCCSNSRPGLCADLLQAHPQDLPPSPWSPLAASQQSELEAAIRRTGHSATQGSAGAQARFFCISFHTLWYEINMKKWVYFDCV